MNIITPPTLSTSRGISPTDLAGEIMRQSEAKADAVVAYNKIVPRVREDGIFTIESDEIPAMPGNKTFHQQLAANLDIPFPYYQRMHQNAPDLLVQNTERWLGERQTAALVRTLDGTARAILSDRYRIYDNDAVFEALVKGSHEAGHPLTIQRGAIADDYLAICAVFGERRAIATAELGDAMQFGVTLRNSETGRGSVSFDLWAEVLSCKNGMTFRHSLDSYARRHSGGKLAADSALRSLALEADAKAFSAYAREIVTGFANPEIWNGVVDQVNAAARREMPGDARLDALPTVISARLDIHENEAGSILNHFARGGDLTQWGLVQAITRHAQDARDFERRMELEEIGSKALEEDEWATILRDLREHKELETVG